MDNPTQPAESLPSGSAKFAEHEENAGLRRYVEQLEAIVRAAAPHIKGDRSNG